ncbi:hypothetical protein [Seinonella peptonophila]|nr:hypothetical protein [Seinonella peptonophila]
MNVELILEKYWTNDKQQNFGVRQYKIDNREVVELLYPPYPISFPCSPEEKDFFHEMWLADKSDVQTIRNWQEVNEVKGLISQDKGKSNTHIRYEQDGFDFFSLVSPEHMIDLGHDLDFIPKARSKDDYMSDGLRDIVEKGDWSLELVEMLCEHRNQMLKPIKDYTNRRTQAYYQRFGTGEGASAEVFKNPNFESSPLYLKEKFEKSAANEKKGLRGWISRLRRER